MKKLRIGQTWTDKKRATAAFTVLRLYNRNYPDGNTALRVKGVLITGDDANGSHLRDLDARSAQKMFPRLIFDPPIPLDDEQK